jgi:hypothetical protein
VEGRKFLQSKDTIVSKGVVVPCVAGVHVIHGILVRRFGNRDLLVHLFGGNVRHKIIPVKLPCGAFFMPERS